MNSRGCCELVSALKASLACQQSSAPSSGTLRAQAYTRGEAVTSALPGAAWAAQFSVAWLGVDPVKVTDAQAQALQAAIKARLRGSTISFTTHIDDGVSRRVPGHWRAAYDDRGRAIAAEAAAAMPAGSNSSAARSTQGAQAWGSAAGVTQGSACGGASGPAAAAMLW